MRTHERVTIAMLVVASVLAGVLVAALTLAGPRVQVVLMVTGTFAVLALLAVPRTLTLLRLDRTGGAMSSGFVSGGTGIAVGRPAAVQTTTVQTPTGRTRTHHEPVTGRRTPDWDSARANPSLDGGSFSLAAGASPHPPQ